jgi:hypothetical protein
MPVAFHVSTRWAGDEPGATVERMREVLAELDARDIEHPSVALTHESEWCLGAYPGGLLVWENLEADDPPRHMSGVSRERVLDCGSSCPRAAWPRSKRRRGCPGTRTRTK